MGHEQVYFAQSGPMTDLTRHEALVEGLPSDPDELGELVRGVLLHNWAAMMGGVAMTQQTDGMGVRGAAPTLDRILALDSAPIDQARRESERLIGYCYHFALLHCALLRAKNVPARARCGFASYLDDGKWIDHWVVEYWKGDGWQLHDSQIGMDVTSEHFHDAGVAWQLCRTGAEDPAVHGNGELWAWDELRGSLINDIGALNKVEEGDWDWCEFIQVELLDQPNEPIDAQLDVLADLVVRPEALAELQQTFQTTPAIRPH